MSQLFSAEESWLYAGLAVGAVAVALLVTAFGWQKQESRRQFVARFARHLLKAVLWAGCAALLWSHLHTIGRKDGRHTVDFAGQWLMGRMLVEGQGHNLYLVQPQDEVLRQGYPIDQEHFLMRFSILLKLGRNSDENFNPLNEVEGPLYPPPAALVFVPLALQDPETSIKSVQYLYVGLTLASAWLVYWGTRGRIWASAAMLLMLGFPSYPHGLALGQNAVLTTFLVVAGWALWARGYPWWGGLVWSCLAYKPVFALALLWVPLVLLRWRVFFGMVLGGVLWCAATLPFCLAPEDRHLFVHHPETENWAWNFDGDKAQRMLQPWLRWLEVGNRAAVVYDQDSRWIWLSRDLYALPRRRCWEPDTLFAHLRHIVYPHDVERHRHPKYGRRAYLVLPDGRRHYTEAIHARFPSDDPDAPADMGRYFGLEANPSYVSRALLGGWVGVTVLAFIFFWRRRRRHGLPLCISPHGPGTAFALFAGILSCYHFMYYDVLPLVLPVILMWVGLSRAQGRVWLSVVCLVQLLLTAALAAYAVLVVAQPAALQLPLEMFTMIIMWGWCGVRMFVEEGRKPFQPTNETALTSLPEARPT